jgi:nucleoside-diphosphate-sugar epimerase
MAEGDRRDVLVIGGTRFMGYRLVWQLLLAGHRVTILNRGRTPDPFGERVERIHVDRTTPAFGQALAGRRFDAAVDFAAFTGDDAHGVLAALGDGRVGQYIVISTGQVYLVREGCPIPSRESDYPGAVMAGPPTPADEGDWRYGVGKREVEDVLAEAWARDGFPSTRLRIPVVNGERDRSGRLESYLWRLLDGGPILLPDGGMQHVRQIYSGAVARTIVADVLGNEVALGKAYNLCQDEIPSVAELVLLLAEILGADLEIVPIGEDELAAAGLTMTEIFPFTGRWNSILDPSLAKLELGFWHEPLETYLERIAASFLAHLPPEMPRFNAHRAEELALAGRV